MPSPELLSRGGLHRRSWLVVAIAVVALVLSGLVLDRGGDARAPTRVRRDAVDIEMATTVVVPPATAPEGATGLTAGPVEGLVDDRYVDLRLDRRREATVTVRQCAAEALAGTGGPGDGPRLDWCDGGDAVTDRPDDRGRLAGFPVHQGIETERGRVDCASTARRCVVVVLGGDHGAVEGAVALSFRADLPALPVRSGHLRSDPDNSDAAIIVLAGFRAQQGVSVSLCARPDPTAAIDPARCDLARARRATTDAAGEATVRLRLFHEILTWSGWVPCQACEVVVMTTGKTAWQPVLWVGPSGRFGAAPDGPPDLRIVEPGPYTAGQTVTLRGSGFQGSTDVTIGWCRESSGCGLPLGRVTSDAGGRFTMPGFSLPTDETCRAPGACTLGWSPTGTPPLAWGVSFTLGT